MAFGETYNVDTPDGTAEAPSLGDNRIREAKAANRERLDVDHYYPEDDPTSGLVDNPDTGEHRQATLRERAAPGAVAADKAILYAKEIGGKSGLAVMDEDEKEKEITCQDTVNAVHVLNLEGKDFTAAAAAVTDQLTIDVSGGKLALMAGDDETKGIQAVHLHQAAGAFCDDDTLEIDADNGLQMKEATLAARLGQAAQAVGATDISNNTGDWAFMTGMEVTFTPAGGDVLIQFCAGVRHGEDAWGAYRLKLDETPLVATLAGEGRNAIALQWLAEGVTQLEHTVTVEWKDLAGTIYHDGTTYNRVLTVQELPS